MLRKSFTILFLGLFLFYPGFRGACGANQPDQPVRLEQADNMHWHGKRGVLHAEGDVFVTWGRYRIYAGEVEYNVEEEKLLGRNNVRIFPGEGRQIRGEYLQVYLESGEIKVEEFDGELPPWYVQTPFVEGDIDTHLTGGRAAFTTCELEKPHYRLTAGRFHIYPGDRLVAYNASLWFGEVPVFYFPFIVLDLRDRLRRWSIRPGHSSRDGFMLELGYRYLMEEDGWPVTGTVYGDLREYAGRGGGIDVEYDKKDKYAYLYYFRSHRKPLVLEDGSEVRGGEKEDLWKLKSKVDYNFDNSNWKLHGEADWAGYARFNKEFERSLAARSQSDRKLKGSLIHRDDKSMFRIDGERRDRVDTDGDFQRYSASLPDLRYQLFPVNVSWLGRGVYYRLDGRARRNYELDSGQRLWNSYLQTSLIKSFSPTRWLGHSFRAGYRHNYKERSAGDESEYNSIGNVELRARNSLRVFPGLSVDLIYNFDQRVNRKDEVEFELNQDDYGIEKHGREEHNIDLGIRYEIDRGYLFLRGGYDLRSSEDVSIKSDSRIYSPRLNFNFSLTPYWQWDQFVGYDVQESEIQQANTNWDFRLTRNFSTGFGWDYNRR
ncbi:MAG: hypothetical protein ACLFN5_05545, partial [bacterium]